MTSASRFSASAGGAPTSSAKPATPASQRPRIRRPLSAGDPEPALQVGDDLRAAAGVPAAAAADRRVLDLGVDLERDKDRPRPAHDLRQRAVEIVEPVESLGARIAGGERQPVVLNV